MRASRIASGIYLKNKTEEGCAFSKKLTKIKKVLLLFNTGFK